MMWTEIKSRIFQGEQRIVCAIICQYNNDSPRKVVGFGVSVKEKPAALSSEL
jgi:hypothetical protein